MDSDMMSIDDLARRCNGQPMEVDNQLKLIRKKTDKQNKWSEFTALDINRFDRPAAVPKAPVANTRRRSISQQRGRIRTKQQSWTRVQSVDRAQQDEDSTFSLLRWPRAEELVLSKSDEAIEELCPELTEWCYHGEAAQDEPDEDPDYHFG